MQEHVQVESVLMDAVYRTPNAQTLAAMKEAREEDSIRDMSHNHYGVVTP